MGKSKLPTILRTEFAERCANLRRLNGYVLQYGQELLAIRDKQLYREEYDSFEEFVERFCGETVRSAQRWLVLAERRQEIVDQTTPVRDTVSRSGQAESLIIPEKIRQAEELSKAPEENRAEAWKAAVDSANGQQPTAKQVKAAVENSKPAAKPKQGKVLFDDRPFAELYGRLGRFLQSRHDVYPSKHYAAIREHLNALHKVHAQWVKESAK